MSASDKKMSKKLKQALKEEVVEQMLAKITPAQPMDEVKTTNVDSKKTLKKRTTKRLQRKALQIPAKLSGVISVVSKKTASEVIQLRSVQTHNISVRYPLLAATAPTVSGWLDEWNDFCPTQHRVRLDHYDAVLVPYVEVFARSINERSTLIPLSDFSAAATFVETHLTNNDTDPSLAMASVSSSQEDSTDEE